MTTSVARRPGVWSGDVAWNCAVLGLDLSFFTLALSLASFSTILPAYLSHLTTSNAVIGMLPGLALTGYWMPGVLVAGYTERLKRKKPFIMCWTVGERVPLLALALIAGFLSLPHPGASLWLALALVTALTWCGGLLMPAWVDLVGNSIPVDVRGRFFGYANALGGALGVAGAVGAQRLLDAWGYPRGYALCFGAAFAATVASYVMLGLCRERSPAAPLCAGAAGERDVPRLLSILRRDRHFRRFLLSHVLTVLSCAAPAFYMVYAIHRFKASDQDAGLFTAVFTGSGTVAFAALGLLGDRRGHKLSVLLGQLCVVVSVAAVLAARDLWWLWPAFALAGAAQAASFVSRLSLIMEFAPEGRRPSYVSLAGLAIAVPLLFGPVLAGWLADRAGYQAAFAICGFVGLAGAALLASVRDPRHGATA